MQYYLLTGALDILNFLKWTECIWLKFGTYCYPLAHAKVCNLYVALRREKDIVQLQVSVDNFLVGVQAKILNL